MPLVEIDPNRDIKTQYFECEVKDQIQEILNRLDELKLAMKIPDTKRLVDAARTACWKMKIEYNRKNPDAAEDECWAEVERLKEAVSDFDHIYEDKNKTQ